MRHKDLGEASPLISGIKNDTQQPFGETLVTEKTTSSTTGIENDTQRQMVRHNLGSVTTPHRYRKRNLTHNSDVPQALTGIENDTQQYGNATYKQ